jgi:hypothetical protein
VLSWQQSRRSWSSFRGGGAGVGWGWGVMQGLAGNAVGRKGGPAQFKKQHAAARPPLPPPTCADTCQNHCGMTLNTSSGSLLL